MKLGIRQSFFAFPLAALLMVGFVAKSSRNPTLLIQSDPSSYLHFAEQLHQESPSGNQTVAVQASLLGASLAMQEGDQSLTASCLIAAADFAGSTDRVMMWDLAVMIDPSRMEAWRSHRDPQESDTQLASDTVLFARYSRKDVSDGTFASGSVRAAIAASAERAGYDAGEVIRSVHENSLRAQSDECNGRIFIPQRDRDTNQVLRVLCDDHIRPIGAMGNDNDFVMLLQTEAALRNVKSTTWAAGHRPDTNPPLRDPSLQELLDRYEVSLDRPMWVNGQWVESP